MFFISLILIPQTFIHLNLQIGFIYSIKTWGSFATELHNFHNFNYLSYLLSLIGLLIFLFSQNILHLFKVPKIKFSNLIKRGNDMKLANTQVKKDPIINNVIETHSYEKNELSDI